MAITGIWRQPWLLKLLFAETATWQSVTGSADASEAIEHISILYGDRVEPSDSDATIAAKQPPRIRILGPSDGSSFTRSAASTKLFGSDVMLMCDVELLVDVADRIETEGNEIISTLGAIVSDAEDLINSGNQIGGQNPANINKFGLNGLERIPLEERDLDNTGLETKSLWLAGMEVGFQR